MSSTKAFSSSVLACLPGIGQRAQFVETTEAWDSTQVRHGVVFIHSAWSGSSCAALSALDRAFMEADLIGIQIVILNNDGLDRTFSIGNSIIKLRCWRETFEFRDGTVVETHT